MHWHKDTITVHSEILKLHGEKSYHSYLSNNNHHDQKFVKVVLKEMIESVSTIPQLCIIESNNCGAQYKSAEHFDDVQSLADHFDIPIIHVFSIAGYGKGEVDHVGDLAKLAIRRDVGTGGKIFNATDCTNFLQDKFKEKSNPSFVNKEITQETLESEREDARLKISYY